MVEDQFRDRTMTFGEHLDELRVHLIRALIGVTIALFATAYFGDIVVKLLVDPVEAQLEPWFKRQLDARAQKFKADQQALAAENRLKVHVDVVMSGEDVGRLAQQLGVAKPARNAPFPFGIELPVADLIDKLAMPLAEVNRRWALKSLSAQEAFVIYFKAVLGASVVLASPWVFYQIYSFVAVGLYAHERRFVMLSLPFSVALFLSGVATCYFLVFPRMLNFFLWTNEWLDIEPDIRLNEWVGFCVVLMLIFGAGFQLPLFMLLLERVGIITREWVIKQRRMAILALAMISAVVTPGGDPITMIFLAVPLYLLFELGLFLMSYFRRNNPFAVRGETLSEVEGEI